jgi:putative phosphoesterase
MKVAILSDIHGNSYALEAVLNKAQREGVEKLLVLGDIVGYYYHPDIILNLLNKWDFNIIKGNHESILKNLIKDNTLAGKIKTKYGSGHKLALDKLTDTQIEFLINLPEKLSVNIDNVSFLLCHGSPWDNDFYIYPDASKDILEKCDNDTHDFVLTGHTHYSLVHKNKNSVLLNPGSVGQSRQAGAIASWAIVNTINQCVEIRATPYNAEKLKREILLIDPEIKYLHDVLNR